MPVRSILAIAFTSMLTLGCESSPEPTHHHAHHHGHHHHHDHGHQHATTPVAVVCSSWTSEDGGFQIDLMTDWTYRMGPTVEGRAPSTGTWTTTDDVIEFTTDADASICGGQTGRYRWMVGADQALQFQIVEDPCEARRTRMTEIYRTAS